MHNSKECFKCFSVKPLSEFYKHKAMADGHLNKCKECTKNDTKENYCKNIGYYKEYDRQRDATKERIELKKRYSQTEKGKESCRKSKSKWNDSNVIKRAANTIVGNAVRDGRLIKSSICEICGTEHKRIHGHHCDYNYPMVVMWLCPKCHTGWHREHGEGKI